jgi:cation:H+ antiporter
VNDLIFSVIGFLICATIIFLAGKRLTHYGEMLSELTGMGKAWMGLVLMASVTSLPELMVGISSVTVVKSPDLALGDVLGSCAANLAILSLMDVFTPKNHPLLSGISKSHILAGTFGIILVTLTGLGLTLPKDIVLSPFIGLTSISLAVIYFGSMRIIYEYQKTHPSLIQANTETHPTLSLKQTVLRYALFAVIIITVSLALPYFADTIAEKAGLAKSFTGALFLAVSTSLPEIAVSIAAVRAGTADLAVGNLMGSNIFNIFILFIDDLFYQQGHLLKDAGDSHLVSILFVIWMTAVAIVGLIFPSRQKTIWMAWDTFIIFLLYILNMVILFYISK